MSRYYGGWAPYISVAERRKKAEREIAKLRKKGHPVTPVKIDGRAIASTFWGKAWCANLEGYRDFDNRLPRGRTYVRNGSVLDLQIIPSKVMALVSGSSIYKVEVRIAAVAKAQWQSICRDCAGEIDSLVELLQGRFSKGVMERLCRQDQGLFPKPSDIRFTCSCPDYAAMCKHIAAVLYGIGARLDHDPQLLFRLRAVDESDLLSSLDTDLRLSKGSPAAGKILETDDLSALFGLELATEDAALPAPESTPAVAKRQTKARQTKARQAKAPAAKSPPAKPPSPIRQGIKAAEPKVGTSQPRKKQTDRIRPARRLSAEKD